MQPFCVRLGARSPFRFAFPSTPPPVRPDTLRLLLRRLALAAVLLFAQQVGVVHAVAHGAGNAPTHQHGKSSMPMQGCDECVAFAQVQGGPGYLHLQTAGNAAYAAPAFVAVVGWSPSPELAFSPRGPPSRS